MAVTMACIAGEEVHRQWQTGHISGKPLGVRQTPFGNSGEVFLVEADGASYYLLSRYSTAPTKTAPHRINYLANLYALKELGVRGILAWGSGGAITHSIAVGDIVILSDLIDQTYLRPSTFFSDSPLGFLRQFPVFCPHLRKLLAEVLQEMKLVHHGTGTAAITEGPRLETPAEIRHLASIGAEVVTHTFAPEVFLARELQMCYAAVCYVVNPAETGSREQPLVGGGLFGFLPPHSHRDRLAGVVSSMSQIVSNVTQAIEDTHSPCECLDPMSRMIEQYDLPDDWKQWF